MNDQPDEAAPQGEPAPRRRRRWRWPLRVLGGLLVLVLGVIVWFQVSPWPGAMVIRHSGAFGGDDGESPIAQYVPDDVTRLIDVVYDDASPDGRLDVFYPAAADEPLPTIVWVHGGGFVAGTKEALPDYLSILASHGYAIASIEYTKAPEATYPTPVLQVSDALHFLVANASTYHVDPDQIVLAGDSAGGHIAAQTAMAIAEPDYAAAAGLPSALPPEALRGTILCSAATDPRLVDASNPTWGFFLRSVMWAYSGEKDFQSSEAFRWAALPAHVTDAFPPSFITTGPYDPLLSHSEVMVEALQQQGVEIDTLFFDAATTDSGIGHEFQMDLSTPEARTAMEHMVALLREVTQTPLPLEGVSDTW